MGEGGVDFGLEEGEEEVQEVYPQGVADWFGLGLVFHFDSVSDVGTECESKEGKRVTNLCTILALRLFEGRRGRVGLRCRSIGRWCTGCFCRGRIGRAEEEERCQQIRGERYSRHMYVSEIVEYLTLPSLDVCALTAAKGVFSGSGASMMATEMAANARSLYGPVQSLINYINPCRTADGGKDQGQLSCSSIDFQPVNQKETLRFNKFAVRSTPLNSIRLSEFVVCQARFSQLQTICPLMIQS